jgi:solute carrier family 25 (mitochondrial iron transporter), member 28/37
MRGIGAVVLGAGPAHALYFSTYEFTKEKLSELKFNDNINYSESLRRENTQKQ